MKILLFGIGLLLFVGSFFFHTGNYWVADEWVYGVNSMREVYPEIINYDFGNGITLISQEFSQTKELNIWQYLDAKKHGALRGKVLP